MVDNTFTITLSFWHPRRAPDEVTAALGVDPHRCWNRDAMRNRPDGTPLAGFHKENHWTKALESRADDDIGLAKRLGGIIDDLSRQRAFFQAFADDGGRAELSVFWNIGGVWPDETFQHKMLAKMADLRLDLKLSPILPGS
jgi:hypothetical protein